MEPDDHDLVNPDGDPVSRKKRRKTRPHPSSLLFPFPFVSNPVRTERHFIVLLSLLPCLHLAAMPYLPFLVPDLYFTKDETLHQLKKFAKPCTIGHYLSSPYATGLFAGLLALPFLLLWRDWQMLYANFETELLNRSLGFSGLKNDRRRNSISEEESAPLVENWMELSVDEISVSEDDEVSTKKWTLASILLCLLRFRERMKGVFLVALFFALFALQIAATIFLSHPSHTPIFKKIFFGAAFCVITFRLLLQYNDVAGILGSLSLVSGLLGELIYYHQIKMVQREDNLVILTLQSFSLGCFIWLIPSYRLCPECTKRRVRGSRVSPKKRDKETLLVI